MNAPDSFLTLNLGEAEVRVPHKRLSAPTKLITMRLGKALILDLKAIAKIRKTRYQTLIKEVLAQEVLVHNFKGDR